MIALVALLLTAAPDAGAATPYYFDRAITSADLEGKTLRELALMRNVIFARAGQVFRKAWINAHFKQYGWYRPTGLDNKKLTALDRANAATIAKFEIAMSSDELEKRSYALELRVLNSSQNASKEDAVELNLLAQARGVRPAKVLEVKGITAFDDPLVVPEALDVLLRVDQLADMSRRDLRILRNTVFARRGRPFTTETMTDYFAKKKWYRADAKYTDKRLTKIDLANIKLIRSVEDSVGGAETEEEVRGEKPPPDAFMMAA